MLNKAKILKDAQKFVAKAQWDKAIIEYEKLLKESPNDSNTHNIVGDLYLKKNDPENAIDSYKKAADVFAKSGFTLKAIALYKKVLNIKPDQVEIYLSLGKLNAERGLIGNANESYLAAASYFSRLGQKGKAIDVYKVLCDLNPDNLSLAQKLADLYQSEGYEREAVSKYIELAEKKVHSNNLGEAQEILEKAAQKGGDRFDYNRVLAELKMRTGHVAEAIKHLEDARNIDPSDIRILQLLAEAYTLEKRFSDTAEVLGSLIANDTGNLDLRKQLVSALLGSGEYDAAWKECVFIIEKNVSHGQLEEAEPLIKEFVANKPDSIEALHCLADIQTKLGKEDELGGLHLKMATLYAQAGEKTKSENICRKLIEKDPGNEDARAVLASMGTSPGAGGPEADSLHGEAGSDPEAGPEIDLSDAPAPDPFDGFESATYTSGDSEAPSYNLPDFPDLDLEELSSVSAEDSEAQGDDDLVPGAASFEIPDVDFGDMEADTAETGAATEMPAPLQEEEEFAEEEAFTQAGEMPDVFDFGDIGGEPEAAEEPAPTPPAAPVRTLKDKLSEIDVFLKYGLLNKAEDAISRLESDNPEDAAIKEKRLDLCKAQGDIDAFSACSVALADIYEREGRGEDAEKVLRKAAGIDPDNSELMARLSGGMTIEAPVEPAEGPLPELTIEQPVETVTEAAGENENPVEESFDMGPAGFDDEMSFAGLLDDAAILKSGAEATAIAAKEEGTVQDEEADYTEDISEADFYVLQGLKDEARQIYRSVLFRDPENEEIKAKLDSLDSLRLDARQDRYNLDNELLIDDETPVQAAPSPASEDETSAQVEDEFDDAFSEFPEPEPEPAKPASKEDDFFDLAAELQDELEDEILKPEHPAEVFEDKQLEAVFQEFKKGVEEQLNKEDYETHYNLGIAYKEMGMLDEAVSEFLLASKDPAKALDCASMLGLCFMEKGSYDKAIDLFNDGLQIPGHDPEEYMGLKFDMATACELKDDIASARSLVDSIAREDPTFRDAADRLQRLNKIMIERGLSAPPATEEREGPKPPSTPPKKSRVSYL